MSATFVETASSGQPGSRTLTHIGAYKEIAPTSFSEDNERRGTETTPPASYPHYLPVWDEKTNLGDYVIFAAATEADRIFRYEPLKPFEHVEHGKGADPTFKDLLKSGSNLADLTASIGAEVTGVQLTSLDNTGKDQLALLVAQKKVVVFRDQDFAKLPIQHALDWGRYFGRLHIHPTSGAPAGYPEIHLVHRGVGDTTAQDFFQTRTNSIAWHSDVTYENQPPGTTILYALDTPLSGGDTLFVNMAAAYRRLSPAFRERLHGLKAVHSGHEQAESALARGSIVRRAPVSSIHPIVRTHPATGEKALYVNPQFTRYIVDYKKEESDSLLKFLYDHIALSQDLQARIKWAPGTVVIWDNRVTAHSALLDWETGARRHIARITPQAEQPTE